MQAYSARWSCLSKSGSPGSESQTPNVLSPVMRPVLGGRSPPKPEVFAIESVERNKKKATTYVVANTALLVHMNLRIQPEHPVCISDPDHFQTGTGCHSDPFEAGLLRTYSALQNSR